MFIARNGDEIHGTYDVIIDPFMPADLGQKIVAEGTVTISGGTGQFEEATGSTDIRNVTTFEGLEAEKWAARAFWIGWIDF